MRTSGLLVRVVRRRPVTAFLVWFFTVGQLLAFLPVLGATNGVELPTEPFTMASTLVGLLLPALVIARVVDGPAAMRGLLRRATVIRLPSRWYAFVLAVVPLASLGIAAAVAGPPEDTTLPALGLAYLLGLCLQAVVHLVTNNLWEEVAWTGFVQARLQSHSSAMTAAAMTGVVFALQHTALVVGGSPAGTVAVLLVLIVLALPYRALMGWLYNRTHSLLLVGAAHAAGDAVATGTVLGDGFLSRLYGHNLGPLHLFAFAVLGVIVVLATKGRLGGAPLQRITTTTRAPGGPSSRPTARPLGLTRPIRQTRGTP
jgi:membrane protease YdiL (CAAX protease family)